MVAFAKLRKATISFDTSVCLYVCLSPSVCLSVRMEHLGSNWKDFTKFDT
jgi:hypothetical protein